MLISEGFGGDGSNDLAGTTADTFSTALSGSGGSNAWSGSLNIEDDGTAYGNNVKIVSLNIGSYVNDSKGDADAIFELSADIGVSPLNVRGTSINWFGFSSLDAPAAGATTPFIAGIGTDGKSTGPDLYYSAVSGLSSYSTATGVTATTSSVTIRLDLTSANYNATDKFGLITFIDNTRSVTLGSATLTSDTNFEAISLYLGAGVNQGSRTDSLYDNLQLTQVAIPEPSGIAMISIAGILLLLRRRRAS